MICRALICDYEHISPSFAEATEHNPENICLLCPRDHAEVTRGRLSKDQVRAAYKNVADSTVVRPPFHQVHLSGRLRLRLGNAQFEDVDNGFSVLEYNDESIFGVRYKEDELFGGYYPALSGTIFDNSGQALFSMRDNEIEIASTSLDVEASGPNIRMKDASSGLDIDMRIEPPNGFSINRLAIRYRDVVVDLRETFGVIAPSRLGGSLRFLLDSLKASGGEAAISYQSDPKFWCNDELVIVGGEGVNLPTTGVTLAKGVGTMHILELRCERL